MLDNDNGCIIQLECKRKTSQYHVQEIAHEALKDTLKNGGTCVIVVTKATVTLIQKTEAENLENK